MRNPENKKRWEDIVKTTKNSLLAILIDDLEEQYQATKAEIHNLDKQIKQHLSSDDWEEMSGLLDRKYKAAVAGQVQRSQRLYSANRKKAEVKRKQQRSPNNAQQRNMYKPRKGDDLSALARLLVKQMKASNK